MQSGIHSQHICWMAEQISESFKSYLATHQSQQLKFIRW